MESKVYFKKISKLNYCEIVNKIKKRRKKKKTLITKKSFKICGFYKLKANSKQKIKKKRKRYFFSFSISLYLVYTHIRP